MKILNLKRTYRLQSNSVYSSKKRDLIQNDSACRVPNIHHLSSFQFTNQQKFPPNLEPT